MWTVVTSVSVIIWLSQLLREFTLKLSGRNRRFTRLGIIYWQKTTTLNTEHIIRFWSSFFHRPKRFVLSEFRGQLFASRRVSEYLHKSANKAGFCEFIISELSGVPLISLYESESFMSFGLEGLISSDNELIPICYTRVIKCGNSASVMHFDLISRQCRSNKDVLEDSYNTGLD